MSHARGVKCSTDMKMKTGESPGQDSQGLRLSPIYAKGDPIFRVLRDGPQILVFLF